MRLEAVRVVDSLADGRADGGGRPPCSRPGGRLVADSRGGPPGGHKGRRP